MERFATDFNVVKHSNLEYPLDYFSLTKNPARHLPDGTLLFDACLNDVLYIAPAVKIRTMLTVPSLLSTR